MNSNRIKQLVKKDLAEVAKNRMAWMPMVFVPLVFMVIIPVIMAVVSTQVSGSASDSMDELTSIMVRMPAELLASFEGKSVTQQMLYYFLGYFMAPMFLMMPMMFTSIIAAESFAGEKERKTLESLLYTPATDTELFLGKVLAAIIPAVLVSWISFVLYILAVNISTADIMGGVWFPLPSWIPLVFWVTPAIAIFGTMGTVLVSARVNTFLEAYQSGGMLVLVVLALLAGQITGLLFFNVVVGLLVGLVILVVDFVLLRLCVRSFKRSNWIATL